MILTIRTDKPQSEIGLYSESGERLQYLQWEAHRELGETILLKLEELTGLQSKQISDITGVVFYEGPGSFTGLRIGASVVNALVFGLGIKAAQSGGEDWIETGLEKLKTTSQTGVLPEYGREPHITAPRK